MSNHPKWARAVCRKHVTDRLLKDLRCIRERNSRHYQILDHTDLMRWTIVVKPLEDTLYSGYRLVAHLEYPLNYPFVPPTVRMAHDIVHPNVDPETLIFHVDAFRGDEWKDVYHAHQIVTMMLVLLALPALHKVVNHGAALVCKDRKLYRRIIREKMEEHSPSGTMP